MPTVLLSQLSKQDFRWSLEESKAVYWAYLNEGVYLGYRKGPRKCAWVGRVKIPDEKKYYKITFGETDCSRVNDNYLALAFDDALIRLHEWSAKKRIPRCYKRMTDA